MRVIVTGGGTGGHIYPAIAIADKFKEMDPNTEILYVGNDEGIEKEIVPKSGYELALVDARWLNKSNLWQLVKTGARVTKGILEANHVIRKFRPDVVIGTGGYVCFPVIVAARMYGARTFLHEQNAYPGLANRTLEKHVDRVFLGFKDAQKYFKEPEKCIEAGNPVRKSFFTMDRGEARKKLGFKEDDFIVFSFGGSLGAEKINEVAFELMQVLNGHEGASMVFGTGKWYYDKIIEQAAERGIEIKDNIRIKDYIEDMENYLAACDLVISRAGALSVAETTVCGKASVLIPSPNVTGNHQYYNAKAVADRGGAVLMEEKDLTAEALISQVMRLKNNPDQLAEMGRASRSCAPDRALDIIYSTIMEIIEKKVK
ncbi:MAG: undecaprenyldiphospho-muramoylpentapeptide beta-N-acetylglucosaminyltransferase [Firmicutes bacterium]|nr:undecaprenyldiphospho-muramoylpentapeptide beta-N-acetylglucosaminyltransferase [Bacillota bacterium]